MTDITFGHFQAHDEPRAGRRRRRLALTFAALALPVLAGCGSGHRPALSDHQLTELCDRPTQFLADVWHFAEPIVGTPAAVDKDHPGKIGHGGGCEFTANGARLAHVSIIRYTPGFLDAPDDAQLIPVGDRTVKSWAPGTTTLTFESVIGGWNGAITLTLMEDPETNEPTATDAQREATATEVVKILKEFKGPDR